MWHDSSCGKKDKEKSNCPQIIQRFEKLWYPISSFRVEIHYVQRWLYFEEGRCGFVPWMGEISSAWQGPEIIQKQAIWLIIWPHISLSFFPHRPGNQIQLFQAPFSFVFHRVHLFLNQLQGRTQTSSLITSPLQSIQTDRQTDGQRGLGISVLQKIHVLRPRPWGTRVPPSLKPRLKAGSKPRWCTGCPVPRTSPLSLSLFPLLSWTAQTNSPKTKSKIKH